jgi:predicted metal-dependent enzyme (double-stranded beta helix superfamily)
MTLDVDTIIERLQKAITEHSPSLAARDVLDELIADTPRLAAALPTVERGGITPLYNAADLTVLRVAWTPGMALNPHDHKMWAAIALYGGVEDNAFYRRAGDTIEAAGGKEVAAGDVLVLGHDIIHSVSNTRREFAVALHVYGGDFFGAGRSEWDFETFTEGPRDLDNTRRLFDEANARWETEQ